MSELKDRLVASKRCIVLTGAGMSVASGIPSYRGMAGSRYEDPENLRQAMASTLYKDPVAYWRHHASRRALFASVKPNEGHKALVKLEARSPGFLLVTQNIDNLHRRAGSHALVELHGNAYWLRCLDINCEGPKQADVVDPDLVADLEPPHCVLCGSLMRPDLVLFGEGAPERWTAVDEFLASGVDLVLLVGTSGTVHVPQELRQRIDQLALTADYYIINPDGRVPEGFEDRVKGVIELGAELALPALL